MDDEYDEGEDYEVAEDTGMEMPSGFSVLSMTWNLLAFGRDVCGAVDALMGRVMFDTVAEDGKRRDRTEFASSVAAGIERL
jgi:hypothetical protein